MRLHPGVRLLLWIGMVALLQGLSSSKLAGMSAVAVLLAGLLAPKRLWRIVRRSRWVFLAMAAIFALGTPGLLVLPELGPLGPSFDGLRLAADHILRLAGTVAAVAILLETTAPKSLVSGLYAIAAPLRVLAIDPAPAAVRLTLVMQYADESDDPRDWREWLLPAAQTGAGSVTLERSVPRLIDLLAAVALAALLIALA